MPKTKTMVAEFTAGKEYGHTPGHQFHDVGITVENRGERYRVGIIERWGSCQGYDEEHGRSEVSGRADNWRNALAEAQSRAEAAGMETRYLIQAISGIEDAMDEVDEVD